MPAPLAVQPLADAHSERLQMTAPTAGALLLRWETLLELQAPGPVLAAGGIGVTQKTDSSPCCSGLQIITIIIEQRKVAELTKTGIFDKRQ